LDYRFTGLSEYRFTGLSEYRISDTLVDRCGRAFGATLISWDKFYFCAEGPQNYGHLHGAAFAVGVARPSKPCGSGQIGPVTCAQTAFDETAAAQRRDCWQMWSIIVVTAAYEAGTRPEDGYYRKYDATGPKDRPFAIERFGLAGGPCPGRPQSHVPTGRIAVNGRR